MLAKSLKKLCVPTGVRAFGGGHHGPAPLAPNGLAEVMHHDDGKEHGHHDHVHTAEKDQSFIEECNPKFIAFNGLRSVKPVEINLDN